MSSTGTVPKVPQSNLENTLAGPKSQQKKMSTDDSSIVKNMSEMKVVEKYFAFFWKNNFSETPQFKR